MPQEVPQMEMESLLGFQSRSYKPELEFPRNTSQPMTLSVRKIAGFMGKESGRTKAPLRNETDPCDRRQQA